MHEISLAETKEKAEAAFDFFIAAHEARYPKAADCLARDREQRSAFYNFPAEHERHLRTTNPTTATFATVRLHTVKVRGCFSRETIVWNSVCCAAMPGPSSVRSRRYGARSRHG
ncbi:transposase [Rhodocaloribacter litoris]|uniref:transposase n=1 Tax=Rhodocaloribacter litoris TaxID=2558931 RepID=UPI001423E5E2|nr:transposase [Rhodocaloribacter litoris]QXD14137.1 transposase [Rhodocaloribacter litoris]